MGQKEYLQKEIDSLIERMRFWRYIIFAIISGIVGVLYSLSQNSIKVNTLLLFLTLSGFIVLLIAVMRLKTLDKKLQLFLNQLKETND